MKIVPILKSSSNTQPTPTIFENCPKKISRKPAGYPENAWFTIMVYNLTVLNGKAISGDEEVANSYNQYFPEIFRLDRDRLSDTSPSLPHYP